MKARVARDNDGAELATDSGGMAKRTGTGSRDWGAGVGSLIRIRRVAAGLTQRELADLAQVSLGTVR
ncbi:MAG TPA: hypothetical protein VEH31_06085, partial [Streptosporangiaceae bacterium]|nr:hypothetical protein [Streptosporangiaceae bacterium]